MLSPPLLLLLLFFFFFFFVVFFFFSLLFFFFFFFSLLLFFFFLLSFFFVFVSLFLLFFLLLLLLYVFSFFFLFQWQIGPGFVFLFFFLLFFFCSSSSSSSSLFFLPSRRHFPGVVVVSSSYYYLLSSFCLFFLLFFLLLLSVLQRPYTLCANYFRCHYAILLHAILLSVYNRFFHLLTVPSLASCIHPSTMAVQFCFWQWNNHGLKRIGALTWIFNSASGKVVGQQIRLGWWYMQRPSCKENSSKCVGACSLQQTGNRAVVWRLAFVPPTSQVIQ